MTFNTWYDTNNYDKTRLQEAIDSGANLESILKSCYEAGYNQCVQEHLSVEPTAWQHTMDDGLVVYYHTKNYVDPSVAKIRPMYSVPPARQPLSDKQVDMLTDRYWGRGTTKPQYHLYRAYVRAIEAIHGIK